MWPHFSSAMQEPWSCAPGTCVYYSSSNFVLLGYVLLAAHGGPSGHYAWLKLDQSAVLQSSA
eukprot:5565847-Amphidinium_carterae.1